MTLMRKRLLILSIIAVIGFVLGRLAVRAVLALTLACCRSPEEMRRNHQ